jgi:hypothetical protein
MNHWDCNVQPPPQPTYFCVLNFSESFKGAQALDFSLAFYTSKSYLSICDLRTGKK